MSTNNKSKTPASKISRKSKFPKTPKSRKASTTQPRRRSPKPNKAELKQSKDSFYESQELIMDFKLKEYHIGSTMDEYVSMCLNHLPSSYGSKVPFKLRYDTASTLVSTKRRRGDFCLPSGKFAELKTSFQTPSSPSANLVQLRAWENVHYYIFMAFDRRDRNIEIAHYFLLTKAQMRREINKLASVAHSQKTEDTNVKDNSSRITMHADDANFERWCTTYEVANYETLVDMIVTKKI